MIRMARQRMGLMAPRRRRRRTPSIPVRMNLELLMVLRRRRSLSIFPSGRMIPTVRMMMTMIFASIFRLFDLVIFNAPPKSTYLAVGQHLRMLFQRLSELAFPATRAER